MTQPELERAICALDGPCGPVYAVGCHSFAVAPALGFAGGQAVALKVTSLDWPCVEKYIQLDGSLGDTPDPHTTTVWGTQKVRNAEVVADSHYRVDIVDGTNETYLGCTTTYVWADVNDTRSVDVADILCVLDAFQGIFSGPCTPDSTDVAPCVPDGYNDVGDVLAVLDAFGGEIPYPCPPPCGAAGGGAGGMGAPEGGGAENNVIAFISDSGSVPPGGAVTLHAFVTGPIDLRAVQVAISVSTGRRGALTWETVSIDEQRSDFVFSGQSYVAAVDTSGGRLLAARLDGGVNIGTQQKYMGTFALRASNDALGMFSSTFAWIKRHCTTPTLMRCPGPVPDLSRSRCSEPVTKSGTREDKVGGTMNAIDCQRLGLLVAAVLASAPHVDATLTIECLPIGSASVTGGEVVEVECFITTDVMQIVLGGRWDLACSLIGQPDSSGTMTSVQLRIETQHAPELYLFYGGLAVTNQQTCVAGGSPVEPGYVPVPPGLTLYLSTVLYEVSDCATGEFNTLLENLSDPPQANDITLLFTYDGPDAGNELDPIPIAFVSSTLTVVTGSCCLEGACVQDNINEFCCQQTYPGADWFVGRSCDDSASCPMCLADEECDDGDACTGSEVCNPTIGTCNSGTPPVCDDGQICNGIETCDPQLGCLPGAPPCAEGLECDEDRDECFFPGIPTVSTWGVAVLALVLGIGGKLLTRHPIT
jgi:hypothetical protein